jgi:two-component system, OmpR family, response regulator ChvI
LRILLVDDEPDVLASVREGLERQGFNVDAFDDPLKALQRFKTHSYDIALLDVKMPDMNGFQLYREILKLDSAVKVRFFTAFEEYREEFRRAFPELDERRFIKKPTTLARLTRILVDEVGPKEAVLKKS